MSTVARLQGDEWTRYRDIRLRSLSDAPDAFWMTHAEEAAFGEERWRERLLTGANFVAREGATHIPKRPAQPSRPSKSAPVARAARASSGCGSRPRRGDRESPIGWSAP